MIIPFALVVLPEVLQVPQPRLVETQLKLQPQLAKSIVLGPVQLLRDEFSQSPHLLLDRGIDAQ